MISPQQFLFVVAIFTNFAFRNSANTAEDTYGLKKALDHQFPYMVSLRRTEYEMVLEKRTHICAGALVDENVVVTAAHCIFDMFGNYVGNTNSFIVVANNNNNSNCDDSSSIHRMAKKIYIYPNYIKSTGEADLAVVILNSGIRNDGTNVRTVPLPSIPARSGDKCIVIGWNHYASQTAASRRLQYYLVQIQPEDFCEKSYKESGTYLPGKQLCTCPQDMQKNPNACNYADLCGMNDDLQNKIQPSLPSSQVQSNFGDSAGILVCNDKITGILAFSNNCRNLLNRPQIFTKIREYVDFLHDPENYLPEMGSILIHSDSDTGDHVSSGESAKWYKFAKIRLYIFFLIGTIIIF